MRKILMLVAVALVTALSASHVSAADQECLHDCLMIYRSCSLGCSLYGTCEQCTAEYEECRAGC